MPDGGGQPRPGGGIKVELHRSGQSLQRRQINGRKDESGPDRIDRGVFEHFWTVDDDQARFEVDPAQEWLGGVEIMAETVRRFSGMTVRDRMGNRMSTFVAVSEAARVARTRLGPSPAPVRIVSTVTPRTELRYPSASETA